MTAWYRVWTQGEDRQWTASHARLTRAAADRLAGWRKGGIVLPDDLVPSTLHRWPDCATLAEQPGDCTCGIG